MHSTVLLASSTATAAGAGPTALLARGLLQGMLLKKLKTTLATLLLAGALAASIGIQARRARADRPAPPAETPPAPVAANPPAPAPVQDPTKPTVRGRV